MTVINQPRQHARQVEAPLRLAVSWTVAASAVCPAEVSPADALAEGRLVLDAAETEEAGMWLASARLELVDRCTTLIDGLAVAGTLTDLGAATQLELRPVTGERTEPLLAAVFRGDQAVYVRSSLPAIARLGGGTYDPPAGTLRPIGRS